MLYRVCKQADRVKAPRSGYPHQRFQRPLLAFAFFSYLFIYALVPAGFMPAALSSGLAYQYCHGDIKSADFLQRVQSRAHTHAQHHHHSTHSNAYPEDGGSHVGDHCAFAATVTASLTTDTPLIWDTVLLARPGDNIATRETYQRERYEHFQARAPPFQI